MSEPFKSSSTDRIIYYWPLAVAAATILFYIPAIQGGFIWDDDAHVFRNPHLFEPGGLFRIWFTRESQQYYPLVYSSFWLEWRFWGESPAGYHIVNVLLHSANASLVFLILRRLSLPAALAASVIFALHPVHVESVAWVSERKNVLSGLFYLLSMLAFLRYEDKEGEEGSGNNGSWKFYAASFALFILALLSKTVTTSLPAILLIIRWMRARPIGIRYLATLLPFFIIGAAFGLLTVWWEANQVGASGAEWEMAVMERALLPGRVVWFYLAKLALPIKLAFIYPRFELDPGKLWQWFFTAGLVILAALFIFFKNRIGRAPIAALAFFVVTLFPALGLIDVYPFRYSFVADHFQYLASLGPIVLVSGAVAFALKDRREAATVLTAIVAILLGMLTWQQGRTYKDIETLWQDVLEKNPAAWIAHNNMGEILYKRGEHEAAIEHYRKAAVLWPRSREANYNLASSLLQRGDYAEAERHFRAAIEARPDFAEAVAGLALLFSETGRVEEAVKAANDAVVMNPGSAAVQNGVGNVLLRAGRYRDALSHYNAALSLDPASVETLNNIGVVLSSLGQDQLAIESFGRALKINPNYAEGHYNLAVTLGGTGKLEEAAKEYKETLRLNPAHAEAANNLGSVYYRQKKLKKAVEMYKEALRINPGFKQAQNNLSVAAKELQKTQ